eukprot:2918454-Pyramimonas_sp.AAC.1
MTQLGKAVPSNIAWRLSLLDRAVSVLRNPENRNLEPSRGQGVKGSRGQRVSGLARTAEVPP